MRKTLLDRFWEKVEIEKREDGCWLWTGALTTSGYGQKWNGGRVIPAHRWSYEHFVGPIPEGLHVDHLCRVHACVNPEHLEPVTPLENSQRGIAGFVNGARQMAKTECPAGHAYDTENTYWRPDGRGRQCKKCERIATSRRRARLRESGAPSSRS